MSARLATVLSSALLCVSAGAGSAMAADSPLNLRFAYWVPAQHPIASESIQTWADAVTEDSDGSISFSFFPAGQLGRAEDHFDLVKDGIADVAWINPGFNPGRWPVIGAMQIPLLINDTRGASAAQTAWYRKYEQEEMPEVKVCLGHQMAPLMLHSTTPIEMPEDLKGLKVRPSSAMEALYLRNAGASTVQGTYPEVREMLSRGVVDATSGVVGSGMAFGVFDVAKHSLYIPFAVSGYLVVINKDSYARMSDAQKAAIDANCTPEAGRRFAEPLWEFETSGAEELLARNDPGRSIIQPTPEIMAAWKEHVPEVRAEWEKQVAAEGYDPKVVYQELVDELRKHEGALAE